LNALILHGLGFTYGNFLGQKDRHFLRQKSGAGVKFGELDKFPGAATGLFAQLALSRLKRGLTGIDPPGRQLPQILQRRQAVLAHQQNAPFLVDRHDDRRSRMLHDGALDLEPVGVERMVHRHMKNRSANEFF